MVTPLPFQGNVIWDSNWTEKVRKNSFEGGSYLIEQTTGANPSYWTGTIEFALEPDELATMLALFKSKPIGLFSYEHSNLGSIIVRRVGGMSFPESYDAVRVLSVEFRTVD